MALNSYVTLGRSGLRVSPICLGSMTFGEDYGWGTTPEKASAILAEYLDRGGNFIDTANRYTNGHSEKIIGDFFRQSQVRRDQAVIGTKFFNSLFNGDPNAGGASRKAMMTQLEGSLRRLQTDYVDIYWLHYFDRKTPIEETMRGLENVVSSGKARYIGFSGVPPWKSTEAQMIAAFRGWAPVTAIQIEYSLRERTVEAEFLPMAQGMGMGVTTWGPLHHGFLSGKYTRDSAGAIDSLRANFSGKPGEADFVVIDALVKIAKEAGASPAAVALAWVLNRPAVSSMLIGVRRMDQLIDNIAAFDVKLTSEQWATLDDVSKPFVAFPAQWDKYNEEAGYSGTTIDGVTYAPGKLLSTSPTRY